MTTELAKHQNIGVNLVNQMQGLRAMLFNLEQTAATVVALTNPLADTDFDNPSGTPPTSTNIPFVTAYNCGAVLTVLLPALQAMLAANGNQCQNIMNQMCSN